ncbi:hypothetical protein [Nocardiopsis ganjiahuensis]|uniref:hypothetical protein n=1 Tax=Nocardiopsis ganjiahuensis TaxID=239984 RepID=UPI00034B6C0A|nr:hypothetical protein [Nocardiopsis ganjiahuensis]
MPNRTLAFAYTACAVFAAVIAFLLATTAERTMYVLEDTRLVWISENDGTYDTDEVAASVRQVANDHDTSVGYVIPDVNEPFSVAHLYLAVADPGSHYQQWLEDGYPNFGRDFTVTSHDIADFGGVGPNGVYLVFGDAGAEEALRAALAEHGLQEAAGTQVTQLWHYFTGGHLFNLLAVALLGSATAVGAGVLLAARDYGVMRLQGRSYLDILGGDLRKVARLAAIALPAVAAATLALLGAYNGWNQLGLYTLMALAFLALLAVPCLLVHAAVLGLVHTTGILPALKGRLPVRSTTAAVYLVRAPVLVLALFILAGVVSSAQEVRDQRVGLELLEDHGDTSFPSLSANYGWADPEAVDASLGPWLREADAEGDMVLTIHTYLHDFLPFDPEQPWDTSSLDRTVLVVNDAYLAEEEVLAPSGERHGPGETVRVIVPESFQEHTDELVDGVTDSWLDINSRPGQAPEVEALVAADGQDLFTYAAKGMSDPHHFLPLVHEPVVIVLPNGAVLSDSDYVAYLTNRSTAFPDPGVVEDFRAEDPEASRYVSMVETLGVSALKEHHNSLNVLRSETFNLLGAGAVLLLTAMAACIVHVRTRSQEIFARHISGWTFVATHRRLLIVEGAIALGFLAWSTWDTLRKVALTADPMYGGPLESAPSGVEPFYALGIILVCLVITVAALSLFHRRIVHEGASRA